MVISEKTLKLIDNDRFIILVVSYLKNAILNFFRNLCRVKSNFPFKFFPGIPLVDNKGCNIEFWINSEPLL